MKPTLPTLLLSLGCSEYNLNRIPPDIQAPEDTGIESNENTVTYDSCDPYDAGWAISPEGTERADCFGIEGYAQIDDEGDLTTQIYYGDCDFDSSSLVISGQTLTNDGSYYQGEVGYSMGSKTKCEGAFYDLGWTDRFVENPNELSDLSLEKNIWLLSREERDFCNDEYTGFPSECWQDIHDPLIYALECNEGATSLVEDCIAFMYR